MKKGLIFILVALVLAGAFAGFKIQQKRTTDEPIPVEEVIAMEEQDSDLPLPDALEEAVEPEDVLPNPEDVSPVDEEGHTPENQIKESNETIANE